jgi:hypothetical protein
VSNLRIALLAYLLLTPVLAGAVTTTTVVDLVTRPGVTQRFLYVRPDAPKALILVISGGSGRLGIQADGSMTTVESVCGPIVRNRQAFADAGFALALLDQNSRGGVGVPAEVAEVVRYVRARDPVPLWVQGGSSSTEAVALNAASLPASEPIGAIFFSPALLPAAVAAAVARPTLVLYHPSDPGQRATALFSALTAAPIKELRALTGGTNTGCTYHLFEGLDAQLVATVADFIDRHNAALGPATPGTALAVEFYNAALDHYFITHIANEIGILDAGVTTRGWSRTGQSFNVYTAASGTKSAVCRYYIPPDKGDSHFYGRGSVECNATGLANPSFVNEDPQFFHVALPHVGVCPAGTRNVYRVFSNRVDANHRYMVDAAIRDQMTGRGWIAEGDGPDLVVMCAPL